MTAREVFADLVGILSDEAAEGWVEAGRDNRTLAEEANDPWDGGLIRASG